MRIGGTVDAQLIYSDGTVGNTYTVYAPPQDTQMVYPQMLDGKWLSHQCINGVVVSHRFYQSEKDYKLGDIITLYIDSKAQEYAIIGTIKDVNSTCIYMNREEYNRDVSHKERHSMITILLKNIKGRKQPIYHNIETSMKDNDFSVLHSETSSDLHEFVQIRYLITLQAMLVISIMMILIAGFGLAASMNGQAHKREKEIGILKAMGAKREQIIRMITAKSIFIALCSCIISIFIGIPLTLGSLKLFGKMIMQTELNISIVQFLVPILFWTLMSFFIGYRASFAVAKRASETEIKDSLMR